MHEKVLTRTEPPQAFLERVDARVKIACTLVWAVSVVTTPMERAGLRAAYALILLILLALNYNSLGRFARRLAAGLPFILLLTVCLPFFTEGPVVWHFGPLGITADGLRAAERVGTTALLCLAAVCLVWATTPEPELIAGLRGVGLPAIFVGVMAFMLRYLHVLRPELHRLWNARAARTIGSGGGARFRSASNLLGAFFIRSHERAVRVADAMAARGYDGHWRCTPARRVRPRDGFVGAAFMASIILLRWMPWA